MHDGQVDKNSLKWQAKYGSLRLRLFIIQPATDGLNEKGLAAHLLYLTDSEYPTTASNEPQISNTLWAQYMLDNFATVNEALEGTKKCKNSGDKGKWSSLANPLGNRGCNR